MSVTGLDLSLTGTGWANWSPAKGWATGTIRSKGSDKDTVTQVWHRLAMLRNAIVGEVHRQNSTLVVIERPAFRASMGHAGDRAALFWLVYERLEDHGIPVAVCPPEARVRYGTGKGRADKEVVMAAAVRAYLDAEIRNNNEADAVLLTAAGARWLHKRGGLGAAAEPVELAQHVTALDKITWPSRL